MIELTAILRNLQNRPQTAAEILPLVYDELRKLAASRMAAEKPGQTLEPTALVHEAFLRLVDATDSAAWENRGHFFAAAAEAMRRILIEQARRKTSLQRGGNAQRESLDDAQIAAPETGELDLLDLDDVLERLSKADADAAKLVKLRFFAGLSMEQAADVMQMSVRSAYYLWTYARSWLRREMSEEHSSGEGL